MRRPATLPLVFFLVAWPWIGPREMFAGEPFFLKGGERIVFFGDSITQAGQFVNDLELFLLTRFPDRRFTLINHGIVSETISGTSETDHFPRRPHALPRFERDVVAWRPDIVVACFGMNDGNYHPFEEGRFAKYREGITTLITRTRDEARATLVLLTPPPFDPYRRTVVDPNATEFGYRYPAIDYDQTLEHYSRWLVALHERATRVIDVHSLLNDHLRRRRERLVSFSFSTDGFHPNATGHWLIAQALLVAWNAPAVVAEARIDAAGLRVESGEVRDLRRSGRSLEATWNTPLPMPLDPLCDRRSIALERVSDRLNRYRLTVAGLDARRYHLFARADGDPEETRVGEFSREQLAGGLDLTTEASFPTVALARQLRTRVVKRRQSIDDRWRKQIAQPNPSDPPALMSEDVEEARIRRMCRPRNVRLRLTPFEGT